MREILLIVALLTFQESFTQQVCKENQEADYVEVNNISINKCNTNSSSEKNIKDNKVLEVKRFRYLKKRINERDFIQTKTLHKKINILSNTLEGSKIELVKKNVSAMISLIDKRKENKIISFNEVNEIPKFLDCDKASEDCFNNSMKLHIENNFRYPKEAINNEVEGELLVYFVIDSNGNVGNIKVSSTKEITILNKEAIRIVSLLPKFIPGKQDGHVTSVSYSFPMNFKLK
ncbi:energy transducer TonB [uncultured Tenacibaculum sp.]|uniref:energy transducer TonB n=1 Tax=uncultured Tenacibaculum sp. TaxID=174713 RepID=UPI0026290847|nr:energy transducer TonB [uncultured Tenacibaculum sp.]